MERKAISGIVLTLTLLLTSISTLALNIQPAKTDVPSDTISTLLTNLEYPKGMWIKGDKLWLTETAGRNTVFGGKICLDQYDISTGQKSVLVNNPESSDAVVVASDDKIYLTSYQFVIPGQKGTVSVVDPVTNIETHLLDIEIASEDMFIDSNDDILIIGSSDLPGAKSLYLLPADDYTDPVILKTGLGRCWSVSKNEEYTYFSNHTHTNRFSNPNGEIEEFLDKSVMSISLSSEYLYYADYFEGNVGRINIQTKSDETLASGLHGPINVRFDESSSTLYFLEAGTEAAQFKDGTLKAIDLHPLPPPIAFGENIVHTGYDAGYIYFSCYGTSPSHTDGSFNRVPALGGSVETLVSPEKTPTAMAFDSEHIYYIAQEAGRIMRIRKSDLAVETFLSGLNHPEKIATHEDSIYFTERDGNKLCRVFKDTKTTHPNYPITADHPSGLALDSDFVYFTERTAGDIKKVPLDGGTPVTIASSLQPYLDNIALDADYVYYTESPVIEEHGTLLGDVGRVLKSGEEPEQILAEDQKHPYHLDLYSDSVYFAECAGGNIKKVPKTGGAVTTLASGLTEPILCIKSDYVYFAEKSPMGGIYKLCLLSEISASVDIDPDSLNLLSKGEWITCYIELPEDYYVASIDVSTILLNGSVPIDVDASVEFTDHDDDGIPDLKVMFDRAEVIQLILDAGVTEQFTTVTLTVTGTLIDGTPFQGSDNIKAILKTPKGKAIII